MTKCAPLCAASKAYGRFDKPWLHEPECPVRLEWEASRREGASGESLALERMRAEMFEQLAPATEGPVVNPGRKRSGRLVFGDDTDLPLPDG